MITVIKIEDLSKQYRLGTIGHGTLTHDLQSWWAQIRGKEDPNTKLFADTTPKCNVEGDRFWALRDINLEISQGEVLGIIGKNGAGKSTLLKILSRITAPTLGQIKIKGRIASLLEVGTGFHPELTGRENIFLNGAILGMTRQEVDDKIEEIIDFSGIDHHIDTPVKRYSSGMNVRLAFAIAAHLEPEILIVDEVLAVGDAEFQKKCLGKMEEVSKGGRTVLFVSHDMSAVRRLCKSALVLDEGKIIFSASANEAVDFYLQSLDRELEELPSVITHSKIWEKTSGRVNKVDPFVTVNAISLLDGEGNNRSLFSSKESIMLKFDFDINKKVGEFRIVVTLLDNDLQRLLISQLPDSGIYCGSAEPGNYIAQCHFPKNLFATNSYTVTVGFSNSKQEFHTINRIICFKVQYENLVLGKRLMDKTYFRPQLQWELLKT
jgi:lipopolysaccharide transport system ATP-binding protein